LSILRQIVQNPGQVAQRGQLRRKRLNAERGVRYE
jgi:hypothetical protein